MEQDQSGKKIFIVSDDKLLLDMYSLKFKDKGLEVIPAYGSMDAMEKLRGGIVPDAIVLDVTAPILDSIDLLALMREEKLASGVKVVILSNEDRSISDEKSRTLGVSGYVKKSIATPAQVAQDVMDVLNTASPSI